MKIKAVVKWIVPAVVVFAAGTALWRMDSVMGYMQMTRSAKTESRAPSLGNGPGKTGKRILIAYFSWGGNTEKAAWKIHDEVGGDIWEIRRTEPYPAEYKPTTDVAKEEKEKHILPAIEPFPGNPADYDVILLGFPVWWYSIPMPVESFLTEYDFKGKTILPFATSGGSTIDDSLADIRSVVSDARVPSGVMVNDWDKVHPWLAANRLINS